MPTIYRVDDAITDRQDLRPTRCSQVDPKVEALPAIIHTISKFIGKCCIAVGLYEQPGTWTWIIGEGHDEGLLIGFS
jgi:hypothetical protein